MGLLEIIKFCLKKKTIPFFFDFVEDIKENYLKMDFYRYHLIEDLKARNKFEKYLFSVFCDFFPKKYLENYQFSKIRVTKDILFQDNLKIFSSVNHIHNDNKKLWIANMLKNNSKLITIQHGGAIGSHYFNTAEILDKKNSYKYITWGWSDSLKTQPGSMVLKKIEWQGGKKILLILYAFPSYNSKILPNLNQDPNLEFFENQISLISQLDKKIYENLIVRLPKMKNVDQLYKKKNQKYFKKNSL